MTNDKEICLNSAQNPDFEQECRRIFGNNPGVVQEPDEVQIEKLKALYEHLIEVNKVMNLTRITEQKAAILSHFVDSLTALPYISEGARLCDVGCGAGFPCLPLAIFRKDINVTALDSTEKKVEYVKSTARLLGLENFNGICGRAEELALDKKCREAFDVVTARAVAELPILCELCLPLVKVGGTFIAMKAASWEKELSLSERVIAEYGGALEKTVNVDITENGADVEQRRLIIIRKVKNTPNKYPRRYSQMKSNRL